MRLLVSSTASLLYQVNRFLVIKVLCPVLEAKDKPQIVYSEIRGYSEVYLQAKFWHFSNAFYSRDNYSCDNLALFVNKHLIGQHGHVTCRRLFIVWCNFLTLRHGSRAANNE